MRVLLASQRTPVFGGSESYLLTIATQLQRLGHEIEIDAPAGTQIASIAAERGFRIGDGTDGNAGAPDAVVVQDTEVAYAAAERHPGAARVYVAHSPVFEPQRPPTADGVCDAIVALSERMRRHCEAFGSETEVVRLRQPIDVARFTDRGARGHAPRRALLFGNHFGGPGYRNYDLIADACAQLGIEVDLIGSGGRASPTPELEIAGADIVFGLGRCILEAMASARAAYVFGDRGGDGWVTPESYEEKEASGFAGVATAEVIDARRMRADLERWDAEMGQLNRQLAIANHAAGRHVTALVELFERLPREPGRAPSSPAPLERMARVQREITTRIALAETDARALRAESERLRHERDDLAGRLGQVAESRTYRVARRASALSAAVRALWARARARASAATGRRRG